MEWIPKRRQYFEAYDKITGKRHIYSPFKCIDKQFEGNHILTIIRAEDTVMPIAKWRLKINTFRFEPRRKK